MKRDIELLRKILLWVEAQEHGFVDADIQIDGYTDEEVGFHVYLMGEAGLLKVMNQTVIGDKSPKAAPQNLTWAGYEFIDASKDETLWGKAKSVVLKPAGGIAFDVLLEWLKAEAKNRLGLPA